MNSKTAKTKKCPGRHPKLCKFGDTCRLQVQCSYKHEKEQLSKEIISIESTSKEVNQLKADKAKLKEENDIKINILAKVVDVLVIKNVFLTKFWLFLTTFRIF